MKITINNKNLLPLANPTHLKGSSGTIYQVDDKTYFKLLNKDYRSLKSSENKELLKTLEALSTISSGYIATPIDIYCSNTSLYGHTMPIMPGNSFETLPPTTEISSLEAAFLKLTTETSKLASIGYKAEDIGGDNILYYQSAFYLIDLVLGLIDETCPKEYLASRINYSIFINLLNSIYGKEILKRVEETPLAFKNYLLKQGVNTDYASFFSDISTFLSRETSSKIKTIEDIRKAQAKLK